MATRAEFEQAMLDAMTKRLTEGKTDSTILLRLAEAYAWLVSPGQSHGGSAGKGN